MNGDERKSEYHHRVRDSDSDCASAPFPAPQIAYRLHDNAEKSCRNRCGIVRLEPDDRNHRSQTNCDEKRQRPNFSVAPHPRQPHKHYKTQFIWKIKFTQLFEFRKHAILDASPARIEVILFPDRAHPNVVITIEFRISIFSWGIELLPCEMRRRHVRAIVQAVGE